MRNIDKTPAWFHPLDRHGDHRSSLGLEREAAAGHHGTIHFGLLQIIVPLRPAADIDDRLP